MKEIYCRRSIRKYSDISISEDDIKSIIKAGMNAPSAYNTKPLYFIVIDNRDKLKQLSIFNQYGKMLEGASHAIIVCAKEATEFWIQDASAATQNMLLEATSLGIGSCWIGLYPKDTEHIVKEYLKIPANLRAFAIISLGYPKEEKEMNDFYEEERIKFNEWR